MKRNTKSQKYMRKLKVDSIHELKEFYNSFLSSFRNSIGGLNAGILTIYELFCRDRTISLVDLNLFFLFLDVYGSGKSVLNNGERTELESRRKNTKKRVN